MKRSLCVIASIILLAASNAAFAQSEDGQSSENEPSLDSVLQTARNRYWHPRESIPEIAPRDLAYAPFLLSFVPPFAFPFGYCDSSFALGSVGTLVRDDYGFMASGVFNIARTIRGFQSAGVFNIASEVKGVQAAGVFNVSADISGGQLSGVFAAAARLNGIQASGVAGFAEGIRGVQASGVFNQADQVAGVQLAGLFNNAEEIRGVQAAPANFAGRASGLQVGLINVADRMDGIQLGLINIARDGATGFGLVYGPSNDYLTAYYQNGTRYLYSVISAGLPANGLFSSVDGLVAAAGVGTRIGGRRAYPYLDVEALAAQEIGSRLGEFARFFTDCDAPAKGLFEPFPELRLRLGVPLSRGLAVVGGAVLDFNLDGYPNMPESLKVGSGLHETLFGGGFTVYGSWFIGLEI